MQGPFYAREFFILFSVWIEAFPVANNVFKGLGATSKGGTAVYKSIIYFGMVTWLLSLAGCGKPEPIPTAVKIKRARDHGHGRDPENRRQKNNSERISYGERANASPNADSGGLRHLRR